MKKYAKMYGSSTSVQKKTDIDSLKVFYQSSSSIEEIFSSSSVSSSSIYFSSSSNKVVVPIISSSIEKIQNADFCDSTSENCRHNVGNVEKEEKVDWCANTPEGLLCDKRDGKTYEIVRFGNQLWMSKNLDYEVPGSWCYDNQSVNCKEYGRLYKWTAALGLSDSFSVHSAADSLKTLRQGACPVGWHIPTNEEMKVFYEFVRQRLRVNSDSLLEGVGTSLKKKTGWEESSEVPFGSDRFAFAAKPAGYRASSGVFNYIGEDCNFWVASESAEPDRAPYWNLYFDNDDFLGVYTNLKSNAYSVRCLKD